MSGEGVSVARRPGRPLELAVQTDYYDRTTFLERLGPEAGPAP